MKTKSRFLHACISRFNTFLSIVETGWNKVMKERALFKSNSADTWFLRFPSQEVVKWCQMLAGTHPAIKQNSLWFSFCNEARLKVAQLCKAFPRAQFITEKCEKFRENILQSDTRRVLMSVLIIFAQQMQNLTPQLSCKCLIETHVSFSCN